MIHIATMSAIFVFVLLVGTASASTCPVNVPFSASIVGRERAMMRPCGPGRFVSHSFASVSDTEIRYQPFQEDYNHGSDNPGYVCRRVFIFRMERWAPLLIELPRLVIPPNVNRRDYCEREQARQQIQSRPQGPTRQHFITGMNRTIDGLKYLRDHECRDGPPDFPIPFLYTEEYLNAWLEAPITYLLSVAYNYGLCLAL